MKDASFEHVVMSGLAPGGGLFVPQFVPKLSAADLEQMRPMSFQELAFALMRRFVDPDEIPSADLERLVQRSYSSQWRDSSIAPTVRVGDALVMELFHGPTFAFKDVALQFLGNLFEFFLTRRRQRGEEARLAILAATSGDTGSAAISGLRGKDYVDCFVLYPNGRVSEIQEQQMATVPDANIHCIAIDGTFDDAQAIVKGAFKDIPFRDEVQLGAVNSINWARILAQITYYFYSYFRVSGETGETRLNFSVPTGNFGDILAGYYARRMGLPIGDLIVATNENDILDRFFSQGKYHKRENVTTLAPSMDICISSNFERFLFHLCDDNTEILAGWMSGFEKTGELTIEGALLAKAKREFLSASVHKTEVLELIRSVHAKHQYLLCPHSAIGVAATIKCGLPSLATINLATAHAAKFPDAVSLAVKPLPDPPEELAVLANLPLRRAFLPNSLERVQEFMREDLKNGGTSKQGSSWSWLVAAAVVGLVVARAFIQQ